MAATLSLSVRFFSIPANMQELERYSTLAHACAHSTLPLSLPVQSTIEDNAILCHQASCPFLAPILKQFHDVLQHTNTDNAYYSSTLNILYLSAAAHNQQ